MQTIIADFPSSILCVHLMIYELELVFSNIVNILVKLVNYRENVSQLYPVQTQCNLICIMQRLLCS